MMDLVPGSGALAHNYRVPQTAAEKLGIWPQEELTRNEAHTDPYTFHTLGGPVPFSGSYQKDAAEMPFYKDVYTGALRPLTAKDLKTKHFSVDPYMATGPDGSHVQATILHEITDQDAGYQKELYSWWGAKPASRWPIVAAFDQMLNSAAGYIGATLGAAMKDSDKERIQAFAKTYKLIHNGSLTPKQVTDALGKGIWDLSATDLLTGRGRIGDRETAGLRNWVHDEPPATVRQLVEETRGNYGELLKAASKGDAEAEARIQLLWAYDGYHHRTFLQNMNESVHRNEGLYEIPTSYRSDRQGMTGGLEGFSTFMGDMTGQLLPQMGLSKGIAQLILKSGSKALVSRAIGAGMEASLTKLGGATALAGGYAYPSLMMGQVEYDAAREARYGNDEARLLWAASIPMAFAAETAIGSPWMIRSTLSAGGKAALRDRMVQWIGKEVPRNAPMDMRAAILNNKLISWLSKGSEIAAVNYAKNVAGSSLREGMQELTEEGGYVLLENWLDEHSGEDRFAKSRADDYTVGGRLWQNFLGGAIGTLPLGMAEGHTHRQPAPYDQGIAYAVARGNGDKIVKVAQQMHMDGALSGDDLSVIRQSVGLATQTIGSLKVSNPEIFDQKLGQPELATAYAAHNAKIKSLQVEMQGLDDQVEAGTLDADAAKVEKVKLEKDLQAEQAGVDRILDGTAFISNLKERALMTEAIGQETSIRHTAGQVDDFGKEFTRWSKAELERRQQDRLVRTALLPKLNEAIEVIRGAKVGEVFSAINSYLNLAKEGTGKLSSGDLSAYYQALVGKREDLAKEVGRLKVQEEGEDQGKTYEQVHAEQDEHGTHTLPEFLLERKTGRDLLKLPEGDERRQAMNDLVSADNAIKSLGTDEKAREALIAAQPNAEDMDRDPSPAQLWGQYLSTFALDNSGQRAGRFDQAVEAVKSAQTGTKEILQQIKAIRQTIQAHLGLHQAITGPLQQLATTLATPGANAPDAASQGMTDMAEAKQQVYDPASQVDPAVLSRLQGNLDDLEREAERLGASLNEREEMIDRVRATDLKLRYRTLEMWNGFRGKEVSRTFAEVLNSLRAEKAKEDDLPSMQYEVLVARAEDLVSEELLADPKKGPAFIRQMLDERTKREPLARNYVETAFLDGADFFSYFTPDLLEKNAPNVTEASAQLAVLTSWTSRLSRIRQSDLLTAYASVVGTDPASGTMAPHAEQQQRILEAIAFLHNPDESISLPIMGALSPITGDQQRFMVRHSFTIAGIPGAGKTRMVPVIVKALSLLKGRPLKVAVMAPGERNANEVISSVADAAITSQVVHVAVDDMEALKAIEGLDMVIVDEAHLMDGNDILNMKAAMEEQEGAVSLFLGDPNQAPSLARPNFLFPIQQSTMRSLPLQVAFRTENPEVLQVVDRLRSQARSLQQNDLTMPALPVTRYTTDGRGVRLLPAGGNQGVVDAFIEHILSEDTALSRNVFLIVRDEKQRSAILRDKRLPEVWKNRVRTMDKGKSSVLGLEADMAFVALDPADFGRNYTRFLYTAVSRARRGVVVNFPNGLSQQVDQIQEVPSDLNTKLDLWRAQRRRLAQVAKDLQARMTTAREKPAATPAPEGPLKEPGGQQETKFSPGTHVQTNKLFKRTKLGRSMLDIHGEALKVAGTNGDVVEVVRPNGTHVKIAERYLVRGSHAQEGPDLENDVPVDEAKYPNDTAGGTIPPEEKEGEVKHTRMSLLSMMTNNDLVATMAVIPFNPDHPGSDNALSPDNPAFALRQEVARTVFANPTVFHVKLVKRSKGSYNSTIKEGEVNLNTQAGLWTGPAFEVHLTDAFPVIAQARAKLKMPVLSPAEMEAQGNTMLGSLFMNTQAKNTVFTGMMNDLAGWMNNEAWPDGTTQKGYDHIQLEGVYAGIRETGKRNELIPTPYPEFIARMEKRGAILEPPVMRPANSTLGPAYTAADGTPIPGMTMKVSPWKGGPVTTVFLRTREADAAYYARMRGELDSYLKAAKENRLMDRDALRTTLAYSFVQYNRSLFVRDGKFTDPAFGDFLDINGNGHPTLKYGKPKDGFTAERLAGDLGSVLDLIEKKGIPATKAALLGKLDTSGSEYDRLDPAIYPDLIASTPRVNMPYFTLKATTFSGDQQARDNAVFRRPPRRGKMKNSPSSSRRKSIVQVREYYRRVFGDRFLDGKLEFASRVSSLDDQELYGVMDNGWIALEQVDGTVVYGVDRHEAVHRVLDKLLDPKSKRQVLDQAAGFYAKEHGIRSWQVTDGQVNEFVALEYEKPRYDTSTLFGRVMRWLHGVMTRWGLSRNHVRDLLYQIENGEFKDVPENDTSIVRYSAKDNLDGQDSYTPGEDPDPDTETGTDAPVRTDYRDRGLLKKVFGNSVSADNVVRDIARELYARSEYAPPTADDLAQGTPVGDLSEAARKVFADYRTAREGITPTMRTSEISTLDTPFEEMTDQELQDLDEDAWGDYVKWRVGDPQVFGTILQAVLPGVDVAQDLGFEQIDGAPPVDLTDNSSEGNTAMVHNTNDELDWTTRQSDLSRLSLLAMSEIPVVDGIAQETGLPGEIDMPLAQYVVQRAAQAVLFAGEERPLDALIASLQAIENKDPESREGRLAGTFRRRYLDPVGQYLDADGRVTHSYLYLLRNAPMLLAAHAEGSSGHRNLSDRIALAERVVGNVVRSFVELSSTNRWMVEHYQGGSYTTREGPQTPAPAFTHRMMGFDPSDRMKGEINDGTRAGWVITPERSIVLGADYRRQWRVSDKYSKDYAFAITAAGVQDSAGNVLVKNNGKGFSLGSRDPELFHAFFRAAGYGVSARTLEYLLETGNAGDSRLLADVVGYWGAAIHAGIARMETGKVDSQLFSNQQLQQYRSSGGGVRSETYQDLTGEESEGPVDDYPMPSMLFTLNGRLAQVEARTRGSAYLQRMQTPKGKTIYPASLGTLFSTLLPSASEGHPSGRSLELAAPVLLRNDPALKAKDTWVNPVLDPDDPFSIANVYLGVGVASRSGQAGVDPNHMSDADRWSTDLDVFVKSVLKQGRESFLVPATAFADRNAPPLYQVDAPLGRERAFTVARNDKGMSVKFHGERFLPLIEKAFNYQYRRMQESRKRWHAFLGTDLAMKDLPKAIAKLDPEKVRQSTLLTKTSDYRIVGKKVVPGKALDLGGDGLYSKANFDKLRAATGKDRAKVALEIYEQEVATTLLMDKRIGPKLSRVDGLALSPASREQLVRGYFFMHHFTNKFVNDLLLGAPDLFDGPRDYQKRSVLAFSPGHLSLAGEGAVGQHSRIAFFAEQTDPETGSKLFDGQGYTTPVGHILGKRAFGGPEGVMKDTVNKRVIASPGLMVKYAEVPVTPEIYAMNPVVRGLVRRSMVLPALSGKKKEDTSLRDLWDSLVPQDAIPDADSYWDAASQVAALAQQMGRGEDLVHMLPSESNGKVGLRGVNPIEGEGGLASILVDNRFWRLQTRLERSLEERNLRAPYMAQISFLLGLSTSPLGTAAKIHQKESQLTELYLQEMERQIARTSGEDRKEKVSNWLRGIGLRKTVSQGRISQVAEMLSNPESSVDDPVVRRQLVEFLANNAKRDGMLPKMFGQMFSQISAGGFQVGEQVEQPRELSDEEKAVLKFVPPTPEELQDRDLTEHELEMLSRQKALAETPPTEVKTVQRALRGPRFENGIYMPGEVLMPFVMARRFGIENPSQPMWRIREEVLARKGQRGLDLFDRSMKVYVARTPASGIGSGHWMNVVGFINDAGNTVVVPQGFNDRTGGDNDGDQLSVYLRRIGEDDNGLYEDRKEGTVAGIQAEIMDLMEEFYDDPENAKLIDIRVGTKLLEELIADLQQQMPELYGRNTTVGQELFTPTQAVVSKRLAADGANLIGIGAVYMRSYANLLKAYMVTRNKKGRSPLFTGWHPVLEDTSGRPVIESINQLLNGMLDNTKGMFMGDLGINPANVSLVMGGLIGGLPLKDAVLLVRSPVARGLVRKLSLEGSLSRSDGNFSWGHTLASELLSMQKDNKLSPEVRLEVSRLLDHALNGEVASRMARLFSLSTAGIPHTLDKLYNFRADSQWTLGATWEDVLTGRPSHPKSLEGAVSDQAAELMKQIRARFNARKTLQALDNQMSFLRLAQRIDQLTQEAFLLRSQPVEDVRQRTIDQMGTGLTFRGEGQQRWEQGFDAMTIALHLDTDFGGRPMKLTRGLPSLDLGTVGGQFRYAMEFPGFFDLACRRIERLPANDPRKVAYRKNRFLDELRTAGTDILRLEMRDGRKLQNDPEAVEEVRRAAERLDEIFTDPSQPMAMSRMMAVYSLVKDGFSMGRQSMARFMPLREYERLDATLHKLSTELAQGDQTTHTLSNGEEVPWRTLLKGLTDRMVGVSPDLLPRSAKSKRGAWYTATRTDGKRRIQTIYDKTSNTPYSSPWSKLSTGYDVHGRNLVEGFNVYRGMDLETYTQLAKGRPVTLELSQFSGWDPKKALLLPTGDQVRILEMSNEGKHVVLGGIAAVSQPELDGQDPALANGHVSLERAQQKVLSGTGGRYYGPSGEDFHGLDLGGMMALVQERSVDPRNRELAGFLAQQQALFQRSGTASLEPAFQGTTHAGRILGQGDILYRPEDSALDTEQTILHEVLHRYSQGVLFTPDDQLQPFELAYKRKIKALYTETKELAGDMAGAYGFKDMGEFVVETGSNPTFQGLLRSLRGRNKQSLWHRFINAVRSLFHPGATNDYVDQVMDATREYIRISTAKGIDRGVVGTADRIQENAEEHGVHFAGRPIADVKDLVDRFMTGSNSVISWSERGQGAAVDDLIHRRIDRTRNIQNINGVRFSIEGMSDQELRAYLKKEVVPRLIDYETGIKDKLIEVFNTGGVQWQDKWNRTMTHNTGTPMFRNTFAAATVVDQLDHRDGAVYLRLSQLGDPEAVIPTHDGRNPTVGSLGIKGVEGFQGFDPMVQVYINSRGETSVVLFDTTSSSLRLPGDQDNGKYLLSNYVKGFFSAQAKRLRLQRDQGGAREFALAMTAMALKQANPELTFRRMKVLGLQRDKVEHRSVWMPDLVHEVKLVKDTPDLYRQLPDTIKAVLDDEKLYEGTSYNQSVLHQYHDWLVHNAQDATLDEIYGRDRLRTDMEKAFFSGTGRPQALLDMLRKRQQVLLHERSADSLQDDTEYRWIAGAILEAKQARNKGVNLSRDTSKAGANIKNAHNVDHDALQTMITTVEQNVMKIAHEMGLFRTRLQEAIRTLPYVKMPLNIELADRGWKRFEHSWRTTTVMDKDGRSTEVNTGTIHWDKNDPETARLLQEGRLSHALLAFNNQFLDQVHEDFVEAQLQKFRRDLRYRDPKGDFDERTARLQAEQDISQWYPRGWVPVVGRPSGEAIFDRKFREAAGMVKRSYTNIDNIFDENMYDTGQDDNAVAHQYMAEIEGHEPSTAYGSRERLHRMGLEVVDGQLLLTDPLRNSSLTKNQEIIGTFLHLATVRQRIHENESLPVVHAVKAVLHEEALTKSIDQEYNLQYHSDYTDRMVYNRSIDTQDKIRGLGINPGPTVSMLTSAVSFTGVAFNYKVAIASGVMNTVQALGFAAASVFSKDGYFSAGDFAKAVARVVTPQGQDLMNALMEKYFLEEWQESDQASSFRKSETRKHWFSGFMFNIGNYWTDHQMRGLVMMAQMIHDGSLEAHTIGSDGKVHYDPTKDGQFYVNGHLTDDGRLLMNDLRRDLIEQGIAGQTEDGPLVQGYDLKSGRNFKFIADKYIIGGMDRSQQMMLNSVWYGRMFSTFKNFMADRIYNWVGRPVLSETGGQRKVVTGEKGEKMVVWEKRQITSYAYALASLVDNVRHSNDMGIDAWNKLSPAEKRMIAKCGYDIILFITAYMIYNGIAGAGSDDKERNKRRKALGWEKRMTQVLRQMATDGFVGSPFDLVNTFGDTRGGVIPVVSYAARAMQIPWHPKNALGFIPGHTTFADTWELMHQHTDTSN
jgi:hypothetical protein